MTTSANKEPFQFHEKLDAQFLEGIYENDLHHAAMVFESVGGELPRLWAELQTAFEVKDIKALRGAAHKCKTLYAYVGYTSLQQLFQSLELCCDQTENHSHIPVNIAVLEKEHPIALALISDEKNRLNSWL